MKRWHESDDTERAICSSLEGMGDPPQTVLSGAAERSRQ
jgi:hypothetical protein